MALDFSISLIVEENVTVTLPSLEYNPKKTEVLLWEPSTCRDTTAFASNLEDGWDSMVYVLSTKNKIRSVAIRYDSIDASDYPICELQTYEDGGSRRIVRTMKDDPKWEFFEEGSPYDFEDLERYKLRLKRERFDWEMLHRY
ncbi:MAG: hypothetical protein V3R99_09535, partial [Thermoguttaceae bacterium]